MNTATILNILLFFAIRLSLHTKKKVIDTIE